MSRLLVLAWLLVVTAGAAPAKKPPPVRFLVCEASGRVLAWEPWANHWSQVSSGDRLPEGSLVQVGDGASFQFEISADQGFEGLRAESARVRINQPLVLRLDLNVMRKVNLSSYFISKFPDITVAPKAQKESSPIFFELKEAWQRFAAILAKDSRPRALSSLNLDNPHAALDAEVAVRSKKIHIYTPTDGAIVVTDHLPAEVMVSWEKIPETDVRYELTVWKTEAVKGSPLVQTPFDYHLVKVPTTGSYYVQVAAQDGRWQSSVHRFDIRSPLDLARLGGKSTSVPATKIPLRLPPRDFTYVAGALPATLSFHWEDDETKDARPSYEFVLAGENGKEIVRQRVDRQVVSVPFGRAGDFRWHVEALVPGIDSVQRVSSETRKVHVSSLKELALSPSGDPFAELLEAGGSRVVYFEGF